jgi:hypothetical protein
MAFAPPALFCLLALATPDVSLAQGNQGGGTDQAGRSSGPNQQQGQGQQPGRSEAQSAPVGAGTTDGTTTGVSGPSDPATEIAGANELPPLPRPALCDAYADTDAYPWCMAVVLRGDAVPVPAPDPGNREESR